MSPMTDQKIPVPRKFIGVGEEWPTHRGKARAKTYNRRRVLAALAREDRNARRNLR